MTAAEFCAWLERRELSDADAAPLLRAKRNEVWRWRTGERKVPGKVERIVESMDREEQVRKLAREWLATAHEMMQPSDDAPAVQVADTLSECANELLDLLAWPRT